MNTEKLETEIKFLKKFCKWINLSQKELANRAGCYQPDVSSLFSLKPRSRKIIPDVFQVAGFAMDQEKVYFHEKVFFCQLSFASLLSNYTDFYLEIFLFLLRNYSNFEAFLFLCFTKKKVPFGIFHITFTDIPSFASEEVFLLINHKFSLSLDEYLINHFYSHPAFLLFSQIFETKKGKFFIKPVGCFDQCQNILKKIFQNKNSQDLINFANKLQHYSFQLFLPVGFIK